MQYSNVQGLFELNFIWAALIAVCAYLIGSVCFSIIVSKLAGGIDIRGYGSGNPGTTNTLRAVGFRGAAITFAGDLLKGTAAVYIGGLVGGKAGMLIAAAAVVLGHCYPLYYGFKGGKAVATTAGTLVLLDWRILIIAVVVWFAMILLTKYVSAASLACSATFVIAAFAFRYDPWFISCVTLLAVAILLRHHENIRRLLQGNENKFTLKKTGRK